MPASFNRSSATPKRIDLHCHSEASNVAGEAVLNAIHCPESYSRPIDVHAQAKRRGMDFVVLTDHDTIDGARSISHLPDMLVGEELTCYFPEDRCKMHILVWGIEPAHHTELQSRANDIYAVAEYIELQRIAHAVAHPIYRQNDKLERWHLERLILMFKGFECLNGAHSSLHREAFEPVLNNLTRAEIAKLSKTHNMLPRWPEPWFKARTAGSDDHGLLNVGRTWTEFPAEVNSIAELLDCIREGTCRPGGEAGSSAKLAHTFYSVAVRYYSRHLLAPVGTPNLATMILQTLVGERPKPTKVQLAKSYVRGKVRKITRRLKAPLAPQPEHDSGVGLLKNLFLTSAKDRFGQHAWLTDALDRGLPPLGEHEDIFRFISEINRDVSGGIANAISKSIDRASFTGLFDSISAILAQQFVMLPYYFACFHQNKERHLLRQITGHAQNRSALKIGLFTDTLDDINGVGRFIRDMGEQSARLGRSLTIHTCSDAPKFDLPYRKNFVPLLSRPLPYYDELRLTLPPLLEVLEYADRQQFDVIHVSTPGPMGLCGWAVSKMLRVPLLGTYHTDFPAYIDELTGDHRLTRGASVYLRWFHQQMAAVFSRSKAYRFNLLDLGVAEEKLRTILPCINTLKFSAQHRDVRVWERLRVREPRRLLYCGRISIEKNLPLLVEAFKTLCKSRHDTALVIAGEGPYHETMKAALAGLPVYFLGYQNDTQLGPLYASSDLFVFPSRTDTLGQVVMEAQASGLPAIVSNEGGPRETVDDGLTGLVLPGTDVARWVQAIEQLLTDEPLRQRMSRTAPTRVGRFSQEKTFETFWQDHVASVENCENGAVSSVLQATH